MSGETDKAERRCVWRILLLLAIAGPVPAGAGTVRFAVIGDYGVDDANEAAVANLVKTNLQPEFIVTAGDNQYGSDGSDFDRTVGKYYRSYIGNYAGSYGAGASTNRFFPSLGNHDYISSGGYSFYTDYFTLPGNERYYDIVQGPVHLFVLNSDDHEPDGNEAGSVQAMWLSNALATSASPWKLVVTHHSPYSSTNPDSDMLWPFEEWGADAVLTGHAHNYERIIRNGFPYLINGAGGAPLHGFGTIDPNSVARYNDDHGAMLVVATEHEIAFSFYSVAGGGTLVERFVLRKPCVLIQTLSQANPTHVVVTWPTNFTGFHLESTTNLPPIDGWTPVTKSPVADGGTNKVTLEMQNVPHFFRLTSP